MTDRETEQAGELDTLIERRLNEPATIVARLDTGGTTFLNVFGTPVEGPPPVFVELAAQAHKTARQLGVNRVTIQVSDLVDPMPLAVWSANDRLAAVQNAIGYELYGSDGREHIDVAGTDGIEVTDDERETLRRIALRVLTSLAQIRVGDDS